MRDHGRLEADRPPSLPRPLSPVYVGMVIGESTKSETLEINVCKTKQLTNMRAAGKDDGIVLAPPRTMVRRPAA